MFSYFRKEERKLSIVSFQLHAHLLLCKQLIYTTFFSNRNKHITGTWDLRTKFQDNPVALKYNTNRDNSDIADVCLII